MLSNQCRRYVLMASVLFALLAALPLHSQVVALHGLKVGDCVQFNDFAGWHTATITQPEQAGGYQVSYQREDSQTPMLMTIAGNSRDMRSCPAAVAPAKPQPPAPAPGALTTATHNTPVTPGPSRPPVPPPVVAMNGFKPGDCVQFSYGGGWETATVTGPSLAGGYPVAWGTIKTTVPANSRDLRACPAGTNASANAETAAAMKRLPAGAGLGAQYGTRNPATCANRKTVPSSSAVAIMYLKCDTEGLLAGKLFLITDPHVQVGRARPFNVNQDSMATGIDAREPVYDIRGAYTEYQCEALSSRQTDFAKTHNCYKYLAAPGGSGRCFKDTFGDWHCQMTGGGPTQLKDQLPPTGN